MNIKEHRKFDRINVQPFGKELLGNHSRLGYIGKEKDAESSLADHGVRKYDSETGRFTAMEPLLDKYYFHTPYHYCRNNPISRVDRNGFDDGFGWGTTVSQGVTNQTGDNNNGVLNSYKQNAPIVMGGVAGLLSGGFAIGGGYAMASAAGASELSSLGGTGLIISGLYSTIAAPLKTIGSMTDNEDLKGIPTTYTGMNGRGVDSFIGNGSNDFEIAGNILQNSLVGAWDVYSKANVIAKVIDAEQLFESVNEAQESSQLPVKTKVDKKNKSSQSNNPMFRSHPKGVNVQGTYEGKNAL